MLLMPLENIVTSATSVKRQCIEDLIQTVGEEGMAKLLQAAQSAGFNAAAASVFLRWRLRYIEANGLYQFSSRRTARLMRSLCDELGLMGRMLGLEGIATSEGSRFAQQISDFALFNMNAQGSNDKSLRADVDFYRLQHRIRQRHHNSKSEENVPTYLELLRQLSTFRPFVVRYGRSLHIITDVTGAQNVLGAKGTMHVLAAKYLLGARRIKIYRSGRSVRILPLKNLDLLQSWRVRNGFDGMLKELRRAAITLGYDWTDFLVHVSQSSKHVVAYHGRPLVRGDMTGKFSEDDDRRLLKYYVLFKINNPDHLYKLIPFRAVHTGGSRYGSVIDYCEEAVKQMFRRAGYRSKHHKGQKPLQLLESVLQDIEVQEKFPGVNHRTVELAALKKKYILMLEEQTLSLGSKKQLGLMKPEINRKFAKLISHHKYLKGLSAGYYDLLKEALNSPRVAGKFGEATIFDVNPSLRNRAPYRIAA